MTLPFETDYAIICDQTRREDNGKLLIIGVYGASVLLNSFPATIALSVIAKVRPTKLGIHELEFRVLASDEEVATGEATMDLQNTNSAFVGIPPLPITIARPGLLKWEMREKGQHWAVLGEILAEQNPATSSTAAAPPS